MTEDTDFQYQERTLAKIVNIDDVIKHPNADKMELAIIGGWQCCVKINEFQKDDKAIYCEVDSLVPLSNSLFTFLEERKDSVKTINEANYSRIKTIKLRKEISQGLLVPLPSEFKDLPLDTNLTDKLGILKYEGVPTKLVTGYTITKSWFGRLIGLIAGPEPESQTLPFPSFLKKSAQERVQNIKGQYTRAQQAGEDFEVSYKANGSSMTAYLYVNEQNVILQGVCSRDREIKTQDVVWPKITQLRQWLASWLSHNRRAFRLRQFTIPSWKAGYSALENHFVEAYFDNRLKSKIFNVYQEMGVQLAIQGELIGPGIQENFEGVSTKKFLIYDVYILDRTNPMDGPIGKQLPSRTKWWADILGLHYMPVIEEKELLPVDMKACLLKAEGKRIFSGKPGREGLVYKSNTRNFSFKVISNSFLLQEE